jgi:hypothetical protein
MNTDRTCKECHYTESLRSHITTDHKEGEQLEDRRNVGENSCNPVDGTDQRVQSLKIIMMMINIKDTDFNEAARNTLVFIQSNDISRYIKDNYNSQ